MGRIAKIGGWLALAVCTACAADPAMRPASQTAAAQTQPGPDRVSQVAARLAPAVAAYCGCQSSPTAGSPGLRLCGAPIKIESAAELQATTNGRRIRITTGMLRFLEQDDELAFVVAHEVSHILLGHAGAFDGASPGKAEAEADRLGIRIVSQAGFDTDIAARLPERLARSYPQAMGRSAAYGLPAERSALIRSALSDHSGRGTPIDPQGPCGQHG